MGRSSNPHRSMTGRKQGRGDEVVANRITERGAEPSALIAAVLGCTSITQ